MAFFLVLGDPPGLALFHAGRWLATAQRRMPSRCASSCREGSGSWRDVHPVLNHLGMDQNNWVPSGEHTKSY